MLLVVACGGNQPLPDIDATAEAIAKTMVEATAQAAPTATPVPPTATPVPPTVTPVPPTATPVPPTATPVPVSRLEYFGNNLYYLPSVTQQEAQRLLDYLEGILNAETTYAIQLSKEGGVYEVRMPSTEDLDPNDIAVSDFFNVMACLLEKDVFSGSAVHWISVDVTFDDVIERNICMPVTTTFSLSGLSDGRLDYGNNILYYLPSVTQQEAYRLLDFSIELGLFDSDNIILLQLRKEGGVYEVRMPFKESIDPDDTDVSDLWKMVTCELQRDVFSGSTVHWIAVGDSFDDIIKRYMCLAPNTSSGSGTAERLDYGNNTVYYLPSVTQQEAQRLLDFSVESGFFDSENDTDLQLRKEGGIYEVRMPFKEGIDLNDTDVSDLIKGVVCGLEIYIFPGSTVHWIAVGDSFDDIIKRFMCF